MRRISPLTYSVAVGEQITVRITQSTGLASLVNYSASNPPSLPKEAPCIFTVIHPTVLVQTIFFTDPAGGSCTTQISGASGGDPADQVPFERAGTEAFHNLPYTFLTQAEFADLGSLLEARSSNADALSENATSAKKIGKPKGKNPKSRKGGQKK